MNTNCGTKTLGPNDNVSQQITSSLAVWNVAYSSFRRESNHRNGQFFWNQLINYGCFTCACRSLGKSNFQAHHVIPGFFLDGIPFFLAHFLAHFACPWPTPAIGEVCVCDLGLVSNWLHHFPATVHCIQRETWTGPIIILGWYPWDGWFFRSKPPCQPASPCLPKG